jgi:hypothetical protein
LRKLLGYLNINKWPDCFVRSLNHTLHIRSTTSPTKPDAQVILRNLAYPDILVCAKTARLAQSLEHLHGLQTAPLHIRSLSGARALLANAP